MYSPTAEETASAQNTVSGLEHTISRLQAQIESLSARKASLEKLKLDYMRLASPVRRLPAELLQEIFCHVPDDANRIFCFPRRAHSRHPVLVLAMVCSLWRQHAISTGFLWSSFSIDLDGRITTKSLTFLDTLLERTRAYTISFAVQWHRVRDEVELPFALTIFDRLYKRSAQWQDAAFHIPSLQSAVLLGAASKSFPQLTSLHLHAFDAKDQFQTNFRMQSAPKLSQLKLDGVSIFKLPSQSLPSLQTLEIEGKHRFEDLETFLRECSGLKVLDVSLGDQTLLPIPHATAIIRPITSHLTRLVVFITLKTSRAVQGLGQLLPQLSLPSLTDFTLRFHPSVPRDEVDMIVMRWAETFSRSHSSIKTVHLSLRRASENSLSHLLRSFDAVEDLTFQSVIPINIGQWMTVRGGHAEVLPRVQHLDLHIPDTGSRTLSETSLAHNRLHIEALRDMVYSRASVHPRQRFLKSIILRVEHLRFPAEISEEDRASWSKSGLKVSLAL